MLVHVLRFRFRADVDEADRRETLTMLSRFSEMESVSFSVIGQDVSGGPDGYTHAYCVGLEDLDALQRYIDAPQHPEIASKFVARLETLTAIDFSDDTDPRLGARIEAMQASWLARDPELAQRLESVSAVDNGSTLRRYIEQVDPSGDVDAISDYVHDDVALPADTAPNGRQGLAGLREHVEFLHRNVRYQSTVEDLVAEGDKVAARITVRGKLIGEFMGLPANGREFAIEEFMIAQFRDGKISQVWRVADLASLTEQLGAGSRTQPASSTEEPLRAAALRFAEATSNGDYDAFDDLVAADIVLPEHPPWNGERGAEALKRGMQTLHGALSDFELTVDDVVVDGDTVVVLQTVHATHSGDLPGLPATGRDFTIQEVIVARYRDGRMVEVRSLVDRLSMMQQVGLIPEPTAVKA